MTTAVGIGRLSRSASRIVGKAASGFHLLRIEAYSQTKKVTAVKNINSTDFSIGGYEWRLKYYPNGRDASSANPHDYISLYLMLHGYDKANLQAQYKLSILDQAGNVAYGLPGRTDIFKSGVDDDDTKEKISCGHERFIRKEDLERRQDLIKDDCLTFRCDVGGFTELETLPLACEDSDQDDDDAADDDQFGLKPPEHRRYSSGGRGRRRRPDDKEFVQWCLAQKRMVG
jgi:speckle-type POZ protein